MTNWHQLGTDGNLRGELLFVQPGRQDSHSSAACSASTPWIFQPLAHQLGFTKSRHLPVSSTVSGLLPWSNPVTVLRGVVSRVVDPVNTQPWFVSRPHSPLVKRPEASPLITNSNSPSTVPAVVFVSRVVASAYDATPDNQNGGVFHTKINTSTTQFGFISALHGAVLPVLDLTGKPVGDLYPTHFAERKLVHASQYDTNHVTAVNWTSRPAPATPLPMGGGNSRIHGETLSVVWEAHRTSICPVLRGEKWRASRWQ